MIPLSTTHVRLNSKSINESIEAASQHCPAQCSSTAIVCCCVDSHTHEYVARGVDHNQCVDEVAIDCGHGGAIEECDGVFGAEEGVDAEADEDGAHHRADSWDDCRHCGRFGRDASRDLSVSLMFS